MKKYLLLLAFVTPIWADDLEKQYADREEDLKHEQTPEEIVADTLTFEEFAEWTAIKQKFEAQENKAKEAQLQCVAKGGNPKTCVDPHWCLYPDKLDTKECSWYRVKYKL